MGQNAQLQFEEHWTDIKFNLKKLTSYKLVTAGIIF